MWPIQSNLLRIHSQLQIFGTKALLFIYKIMARPYYQLDKSQKEDFFKSELV